MKILSKSMTVIESKKGIDILDRTATYGEAARQSRLNAGLTQLELVERAEVSENTLYYFESGRSMPRLETLIKLADAMDISLDEYIGRRK